MSFFKFSLFSVFLITFFSLNNCSGVYSTREAILGSINSGLTPAPGGTEGENPVTVNITEPAKDDPKKDFTFFPYDLQPDTIAYLSCRENSFFTFKVGSYFSRSGVRLSEYFLQKQEEDNLENEELKSLIRKSTKYIATPKISIAGRLNFLYSIADGFFNIVLYNELSALVRTKNTRLNELDGENIEAKIKDGPRSFSLAEALNNNDYRLIISYRNAKGQIYYQSGERTIPGLDIYGRAYHVDFEEKLTYRYVLDSVQETKLPEKESQTDWTCPEELKLEIRRNEENAYTARKGYNAQQNARYKKAYPSIEKAIAEAGLPTDELTCEDSQSGGSTRTVLEKILGQNWNINVTQGCVSPKSASQFCYSRSGLFHINFSDQIENCKPIDKEGKNECPHFLSICIRQN